MRIITGKAKGCKLRAPKGLTTRPTADRVKESLFNILRVEAMEAKVLDLFAGSGNLGLEALSRGAISAVFVDQSRESSEVIRANALHTKLMDKATIIKNDVFATLENLNRQGETFNLLFCDPPYSKGFAQKVLLYLDQANLLTEGAIVVIEHDRSDDLTVSLRQLVLQRNQSYGSTRISFFVFAKEQQVGMEAL